MEPGRLSGGSPARLELGVASEGQRELASHVLDLGEQAEGIEVVGALLEDRRDLRLGLGQLAELDEHASFLQALLALHRCVNHCSQRGAGVFRSSSRVEGDCSAVKRILGAGPQTPRYRALISSLRRSASGGDSWTILPLLMR